jgi:hypothetical protein
MHLIAQNKYKFNIPVSLQRNHLLDIWHLDKAHWFTLCGVRIGEVFTKSPQLVRFNLHRFGLVKEVNITQDDATTEVILSECFLRFVIEENDSDSHYLHVSLFSQHKLHRLLWPAIQVVFLLTVIEDILYYSGK